MPNPILCLKRGFLKAGKKISLAKTLAKLLGSMDIYHNPLGAKQIPIKLLQLPGVSQLTLQGDGVMEWVNSQS